MWTENLYFALLRIQVPQPNFLTSYRMVIAFQGVWSLVTIEFDRRPDSPDRAVCRAVSAGLRSAVQVAIPLTNGLKRRQTGAEATPDGDPCQADRLFSAGKLTYAAYLGIGFSIRWKPGSDCCPHPWRQGPSHSPLAIRGTWSLIRRIFGSFLGRVGSSRLCTCRRPVLATGRHIGT